MTEHTADLRAFLFYMAGMGVACVALLAIMANPGLPGWVGVVAGLGAVGLGAWLAATDRTYR